jgi:fructokinase
VISGRPILFGEILFDRFPDGSERLGGAPLNVAAHLAGLGARPLLVSRVGADPPGDRVRARLAELGLDLAGVQCDPRLATGAVEVRIESGEPRFEILPERAWDRIALAPARRALARVEPALLCHGTLAARSARSRRTLAALTRDLAAPRVVDVNLRPPWTPAARARELARGAAWLKVSRAELARLLDLEGEITLDAIPAQARTLARRLSAARVAVTDGERGAWLVSAREPALSAPAAAVPPGRFVDPVGAGDAFTAALLLGALGGWPESLALARGNELAAHVCTLRGALPADADAFYAPLRRAWELAA